MKKQIETTKKQIEAIEKEIEIITEQIDNFELDPDKYEEAYCDTLDECYDKFMDRYNASRVLKEIDPIAYRCGLNDYIDGLELEDDEEYTDLLEKKEDLENELEDLEIDLEELENELEDLEN